VFRTKIFEKFTESRSFLGREQMVVLSLVNILFERLPATPDDKMILRNLSVKVKKPVTNHNVTIRFHETPPGWIYLNTAV
jgi:hypothetical protein